MSNSVKGLIMPLRDKTVRTPSLAKLAMTKKSRFRHNFLKSHGTLRSKMTSLK